jgi:hypothetical protein
MATVMPTDQPVDTPPVRELGQLPTLDMEDIEFAQRAEEVTGRMPGWSDDLQLLAEAVKTNTGIGKKFAFASKGFADDAKTTVDLANAAVAGALAAGNFRGNWVDQVGALNRPASVLHNNILWFLARDVANVAAEEPGVSSAWIDLMGRVTKVNGRTGDVSGLVETGIGATRNKSQLMANAPIGQWAAFSDTTGVGVDWPPGHATVNWWNVMTFGTSIAVGRVTQRASQTLNTGYQGWIFERQLHDAVWGPWQRVLTDGALIEKALVQDTAASAITLAAVNGSIQYLGIKANITISLSPPRSAGDQLTLRIYQYASWTVSFGAGIALPAGATLPALASGQWLTLTFLSSNSRVGWDMFIGGVHAS